MRPSNGGLGVVGALCFAVFSYLFLPWVTGPGTSVTGGNPLISELFRVFRELFLKAGPQAITWWQVASMVALTFELCRWVFKRRYNDFHWGTGHDTPAETRPTPAAIQAVPAEPVDVVITTTMPTVFEQPDREPTGYVQATKFNGRYMQPPPPDLQP